jgi:dynein heavy chain
MLIRFALCGAWPFLRRLPQAQPTGRQFAFSEEHIFGNFDSFCRRLMKMVDIASTIQQFRALAEHKLEGMSEIVRAFFKLKTDFQARKFDALDYGNAYFDQTYQVFNQNVLKLEQKILVYINSSFENITSIKDSLVLLKKLQRVLQRDTLSRSLDNKFLLIFHNYGLHLNAVQDVYEKYKHNPPMPRNTPPVTGNILWCRHLLKRIEQPMKEFERNPNILATKEAKRIVKTFNNVARTLVSFEYLWYDAWCRAIDAARAGLSATLIIQHPETGRLYVNFDADIFRLLREAKCLSRMNIQIPEVGG